MVYLTLPCLKKIEILHESVLGVSPVLQVVPQGLFTSRRSRQRAHINGRSCDTPLSSPWGGVRRGTDNRFPAHTPSATSPPCAPPSLLSRTNKERSPNPLQSNDIGRTEQGEPRAVLPTETRMTGHFGNAYLFVWQGASFFCSRSGLFRPRLVRKRESNAAKNDKSAFPKQRQRIFHEIYGRPQPGCKRLSARSGETPPQNGTQKMQ